MLPDLYHYTTPDTSLIRDIWYNNHYSDNCYPSGLWVSTRGTPVSWDTWRKQADDDVTQSLDMKKCYRVHLASDHRILVIDSVEKLNEVVDRYNIYVDGYNGLNYNSMDCDGYRGIFMYAEALQDPSHKHDDLRKSWWLDMGCIWSPYWATTELEKIEL